MTQVAAAAGEGAVDATGARSAKPIMTITIPSTNAMAARPKATTEVNSEAYRNAESMAVARSGSSRSSSA